MDAEARQRIVQSLSEFAISLARYSMKVKDEEEGVGNFSRSTTDILARNAALAKEAVEAVWGPRILTNEENIRFDPWERAFTRELYPGKIESIDYLIEWINFTIGRLERDEDIRAIRVLFQPSVDQKQKVFIAHDGDSDLRNQLELAIWNLSLASIISMIR